MRQKLAVFGLTLTVLFCAAFPLSFVSAADTSYGNYINGGYYNSLLSDGDYVDINSMNAGDIQNFLASKGSYLASAPSSQLGEGANGRSAAQIIYDMAHANDADAQGSLNGITISSSTGTLSPRAILVTLEKEQGLVSKTGLDQRALDCAMGYEGGHGCQWMFDNHSNWKGFTHQVGWASWQLRYNYEAGGQSASWWSSHYAGQSAYYVGYSRSHYSAHDGQYYIVTYRNKATAALYRYTPYVSNGNYNFWQLMINWFGVGAVTIGGGQQTFDDTDLVSQTTYRTSIKFTGTKSTDERVYYNGSRIADTGSDSWTTTISPSYGTHDYAITYQDTNGSQVNQKTITINRLVPGDADSSGTVDILDVSLMAGSWGQTVKDDAGVNLNPDADSTVDLLDFSILAANFGKSQ